MGRDRPSGLDELEVRDVRVEVVFPRPEQVVGADSIVRSVVRADGLLTAVDVIVRHSVRPDTFWQESERLREPRETVEATLPVRIPRVETGTVLLFIAGAEDVSGGRWSSEPVPVIVIDCVEFSLSC